MAIAGSRCGSEPPPPDTGDLENTPTNRRARLKDAFLAFGAYGVLTVVAFHPLVTGISTSGIPTGDVFGNLWALHWVSHHLLAPTQLFAANIYYPAPAALAYTESLLAQSFAAAPLLGLGFSLIAAYNVVWLSTFPLSGLGAYLLAEHLTRSRGGAFLAGLVYAFSSYRLESIVHLQTLSIQWLPFALLFLLRSLKRPSIANLAGLDACVMLQALSSGYYAALLPLALAVPFAFHARQAGPRAVLRVVGALCLAALLAVPAFLPYWQAQQALHLVRRHGELVRWSASWHSYLRPTDHVWFPTLRPLQRGLRDGPAFYPGTATLLLAACALVLRRRPVAFLVVLGGMGALLSFGPEIHVGSWTFPGPYTAIRSLPGYRLLRAPERMAPMALVACSALAAIGWASLGERFPSFRRWRFLLLLLALGEGAAIRSSRMFGPMPVAPAFSKWLADAPRGPVIEIPWTTSDGGAVYRSVSHGQQLVNGWGAFAPPESIRIGLWGARWPGPGAVHVLRGAGVRYVVVHANELPATQAARIGATANLPRGVALAALLGEDRVYTISAEGPADPPPGATSGETP